MHHLPAPVADAVVDAAHLVRRDAPDEVVLATGPTTEERISRADIAEMRPGTVSVSLRRAATLARAALGVVFAPSGAVNVFTLAEDVSAGTAVATVVACGTGSEPMTAAIDAMKRTDEPIRTAGAA